MGKVNIWQSQIAPQAPDALWLRDNKLYFLGLSGWEEVGGKDKEELGTDVEEATTTEAGLVKQMPSEEYLVSSATKADIINKVNALMIKLKAAGIME